MSSYLQRLAQVFVQEVGEQLTEYTFVFPNRRAGLFFRRYLGQSLQRPIFSPEIMTINDCFASLSDLHVVDQLSLLVRLYDHYIALRPNGEPIERVSTSSTSWSTFSQTVSPVNGKVTIGLTYSKGDETNALDLAAIKELTVTEL